MHTPLLVLEGDAVVDVEDGGRAMIVYVGDQSPRDGAEVFVRVQSWSDESDHSRLAALVGQRLRVTVELLTSAPSS